MIKGKIICNGKGKVKAFINTKIPRKLKKKFKSNILINGNKLS